MHATPFDVITLAPRDAPPRLALRLRDGRVLDLQAAHIALRGVPSPHLRNATALRLAASFGDDLVRELATAAPASAMVAS